MKAYLVPTIVGIFAISDKNKVLSFKPFSKEPRAAAERFKLAQIELLDEEKQIKQQLGKKGYREFIFSYRKTGEKHFEPNSPAEKYVKQNLAKLAIEKNFGKDEKEINQFLTKATIEIAKVQIKKAIQRDSLIVQASAALEDLDKSTNIAMERLREWYGLHFPEMDRNVQNHEKFAKLVSMFGSRESIVDTDLEKFKKNSMGADFKKEDIEMIQVFSKRILEMYKLREDITKYLETILKELAPNMLDVAGAPLTTKLIAKAGGLKRLSRMPSSTVQLLGAEKALFRFLHGKGKSPRHGVIFSHPLIQNAKDQYRGKLARAVASKISMAAKMDYYSKKYKGDKLKKELQEKAKTIISQK